MSGKALGELTISGELREIDDVAHSGALRGRFLFSSICLSADDDDSNEIVLAIAL